MTYLYYLFTCDGSGNSSLIIRAKHSELSFSFFFPSSCYILGFHPLVFFPFTLAIDVRPHVYHISFGRFILAIVFVWDNRQLPFCFWTSVNVNHHMMKLIYTMVTICT
jgi:hypothetical protein